MSISGLWKRLETKEKFVDLTQQTKQDIARLRDEELEHYLRTASDVAWGHGEGGMEVLLAVRHFALEEVWGRF